ncbi:MAG: DUF2442 domain-containing protein [Kiritimatiellae bacterium]|nr:DUF2442 domain-containing protein [Kiritimatiellia bacterium]
MRIVEVIPKSDYTLQVIADDGRTGIFDVRPYREFEAFAELKEKDAFVKIMNGDYFVEWDFGADLSADTIEAHLHLQPPS